MPVSWECVPHGRTMTCPIEFLKKLAICIFVQNVVSPFLAAPFPPPSRGLKDSYSRQHVQECGRSRRGVSGYVMHLCANVESPSLAALFPGLSCGLNVPTQKNLRTCCLIVDTMRKIVAVPVRAQGTSLPLGPGGSYGLALGRSGTS